MKLEAKHIFAGFEGKAVLDDVSFAVGEKQLVAIVGPSGVGKTTLFNIVCGVLQPDKGRVFLNGEDVTGVTGKVSYMPQRDMLLPYKTVLDNVALPLTLKGEKKKYARMKAQAYFNEFGLAGTEKQYPAELSGGMRQRAAFLRTYLSSAEVALLDEPFSALDALTRQSIHQWYLDMTERLSLSAALITHDIDEAILLADRVYVLAGVPGRIVGEFGIGIPYPRNRETALTDGFRYYKKLIMDCLKESAPQQVASGLGAK